MEVLGLVDCLVARVGILGRDKEPRKDALEAASYVGDVDER